MKFSNHHVSDLVVRIKNECQRSHTTVILPNVKLVYSVLVVLQEQGYIGNIVKCDAYITVELRFIKAESVIKQIKVVSKPSKRIYKSVGEIPSFFNGLGITIVSTPKGVLTDVQARESGVGGEILCQVF